MVKKKVDDLRSALKILDIHKRTSIPWTAEKQLMGKRENFQKDTAQKKKPLNTKRRIDRKTSYKK